MEFGVGVEGESGAWWAACVLGSRGCNFEDPSLDSCHPLFLSLKVPIFLYTLSNLWPAYSSISFVIFLPLFLSSKIPPFTGRILLLFFFPNMISVSLSHGCPLNTPHHKIQLRWDGHGNFCQKNSSTHLSASHCRERTKQAIGSIQLRSSRLE